MRTLLDPKPQTLRWASDDLEPYTLTARSVDLAARGRTAAASLQSQRNASAATPCCCACAGRGGVSTQTLPKPFEVAPHPPSRDCGALLHTGITDPCAVGLHTHRRKTLEHPPWPAGMFLNTQNGSIILSACSRRELPAGLPFAHRLWDVLVMNGVHLFMNGTRGCMVT